MSSKGGNYNLDIYNHKNKIGYVYGNYKKGDFTVDIKNIPIKKIPFILQPIR